MLHLKKRSVYLYPPAVCMQVSFGVYMCLCMCVCVRVCTCVYIRMYLHVHTCVCMCVCVCVCVQGGNLSAMDLLSVANLVNYFGKTPNVEAIEVSPLLLQKGTTRLALYGLGSCRDERLHRMMRRKNVTFLRPEGEREGEREGEEVVEEWFSLLVLHQNRFYYY